ncbi:MAG: YdcF family protein [Ruminococcus sp.]|nr:YdcF family protein [Candidatus Apopatosoma intestinale]
MKGNNRMKQPKKKRLWQISGLILAIGFLLVLAVPAGIGLGTRCAVFPVGDVPDSYEIAVVFGASVRYGELSDMLRDRMDTAISLYRSGKVNRLLLSGDCEGEDYDEVGAMRRYALAQGVAEEDILLDPNGYSTYDTVSNAKSGFGISRAVLVTQKYHLYRALYIARTFGIEAVGADAAVRSYFGQPIRAVREILALNKDFWKCLLSK